MKEPHAKLKGIGGWLLLLCLALTILDPATMICSAFFAADMLRAKFQQHPEVFRFALLDGACRIALAVFSIYSGLSLWRIESGAIARALIYLRIILLYSILFPFLPYLLGMAPDMTKDMTLPGIINCIFVFLYVIAWSLYLKRSKRVRATFGMTEEPRV